MIQAKLLHHTRTNVENSLATISQAYGPLSGSGSGTTYLIFPESVATNGESLLTFKKTPFSGGVSVQPVVIQYVGS